MLAGVFTYRSVTPFSAVAGRDINGDAATTDYVPGTTRNVFIAATTRAELDLVNAWRAVNHLAPLALSADQLERVLRARPARQQAAVDWRRQEDRAEPQRVQRAEQDEPALQREHLGHHQRTGEQLRADSFGVPKAAGAFSSAGPAVHVLIGRRPVVRGWWLAPTTDR